MGLLQIHLPPKDPADIDTFVEIDDRTPKEHYFSAAISAYVKSGAPLSAIDFQSAEIDPKILTSIDFSGAKAAGVDLSHYILADCRGTGADFTGSIFNEATFKNSMAENKDSPPTITLSDFKNGSFEGAMFAHMSFLGCQFDDANMKGLHLTDNSRIDSSSVTKSSLKGANLNGLLIDKRAQIRNADATGSRLDQMHVSHGHLYHIAFDDSVGSGITIADSTLEEITSLARARLSGNIDNSAIIACDSGALTKAGLNLGASNSYKGETDTRSKAEAQADTQPRPPRAADIETADEFAIWRKALAIKLGQRPGDQTLHYQMMAACFAEILLRHIPNPTVEPPSGISDQDEKLLAARQTFRQQVEFLATQSPGSVLHGFLGKLNLHPVPAPFQPLRDIAAGDIIGMQARTLCHAAYDLVTKDNLSPVLEALHDGPAEDAAIHTKIREVIEREGFGHYRRVSFDKWYAVEINRVRALQNYTASTRPNMAPTKRALARRYARLNIKSACLARGNPGEMVFYRRALEQFKDTPDIIGQNNRDYDKATCELPNLASRLATMSDRAHHFDQTKNALRRGGHLFTGVTAHAMPDKDAQEAYLASKGIRGDLARDIRFVFNHPLMVHGMRVAHQFVGDAHAVANAMATL